MNILDIVLLVVLFLSAWFGFWFGLIQTLGGLVGAGVGAFAAGVYYEPLASWLGKLLPWSWSEKVFKVLAFIAIFAVVTRLVAFIFKLIDKTFKLMAIIPFLKTINRLVGAILGLLLGAVVLGFVFFIYSKYAFWPTLDARVAESQIVPMLIFVINFLLTFLPEELKQLKGLI